MTTTEHYQLNTWAEEDFVSLTQMNENFTKLDTALHGRKLDGDWLHAELMRTRCNQAQTAMAAAKGGGIFSALENVMACGFMNCRELTPESRIAFFYDGRLRKANKSVSASIPASRSASAGDPMAMVSGMAQMCEFEIDGWCDVTLNPTCWCTSEYGASYSGTFKLYLFQDGVQIRESPSYSFTRGNIQGPVWVLTNVEPSLLEVWVELKDNDKAGYFSTWTSNGPLTPTAITSNSYTAVTKAANVTGRSAWAFLRYQGTAPTLSYQFNGGTVTAAPAPVVTDEPNMEWADFKMAAYNIDFGSDLTDAALQWHITVGDDTQVDGFCAAVV